MDLVQIRWQQIRLAEASQSIVRENYELKQKIAQLQLTKSASKQPTKSSIDQKVINNIQDVVLEYTKQLSQNLLGVKADVAGQIQTLAQFQQIFRQVTHQYGLLMADKDEQLVAKVRENQNLQSQIEILSAKLSAGDSSKREENVLLSQKIQRLEKEIESLTKVNTTLEETVSVNRIEIIDLKAQKGPLMFALQTLEATNEALRASMLCIEEESRTKLQEAAEIRQKLTVDYEKMIEEMSADNQYLRNTIGELEEQIAKLSNSLVGNRSHFAKYVEVKSENIMLQSKLESLTAVKGRVPNFLPQLASGVATNASKDSSSVGPGSGRRGSSENSKISSAKVVPSIPIERYGGQGSVNRGSSGGGTVTNPSPRVAVTHSGRTQQSIVQGSGKNPHEGLILSARSHGQLDPNVTNSNSKPVDNLRHAQQSSAAINTKSSDKVFV